MGWHLCKIGNVLKSVLLRFEGVKLRYRKASLLSGSGPWVLNGIDFGLEEGECLGVIGQNGCGKSTLLKTCAGILSPCEGKITLAKGLGWPQLLSLNAGFEAHLNAADNLRMMGMLMGKPRVEVEARIPEIISLAGLEEVSDQALGTYSHGMKARLGFTMALESKSPILCIDEIFSVGDASFRETATERLKKRLNEGASSLMASHQPKILINHCERTLWLEKGKVLRLGPTEEVLQEYSRWAREKAKKP